MRNLANPSDRTALLRRFDRLTPATPPRWGMMSATQMLHHVTLAFGCSLNEFPIAESPVRKFDNPFYRFVALSLPVPWPKGIAAPPELDFLITPPPQADFSELKSRLAVLVDRFGEASWANLRSVHPVLGPLSHAQWMRWGFRHTDHHLRQFGC